jgi:hemerythrin-like domain-containing protein
MAEEPDLRTWGMMHRAMRHHSARLAKAVAEVDEHDRTPRATALGRWFAGFVAELHGHHAVEDHVFFPALVARVPEAAALVERIDVDHHRLDDLLSRGAAALERLANPGVAFRVVHAEAMMVTEGLKALLDAHLDYEDEVLVPLFAEHFDAAGYKAVEKGTKKHMSLRQLWFTVPCVAESLDELERREVIEEAELPIRLVWFLSRRRYQRLIADAFPNTATPLAV